MPVILKALRKAFPLTLPVMAGFLFLGVSYGVIMYGSGLGTLWTFLTSWLVFAGSLQYVAVTILVSAFDPIYALIVTLTVNARHIFYGLSMLDKIEKAGRFRPYVIYALCDETFSILCSADVPDDVDSGWFMFFVAFLNRWYWITGGIIGSLLGNVINFSTKGLDFALTALFAVIFLDQWTKRENRSGAVIGVICSALCLLLLGPKNFVVPTMALMLTVFRFMPQTPERGRV